MEHTVWNKGNETRYQKRCQNCQKQFESKVVDAEFCTRSCYYSFTNGENHPMWSGGRTQYKFRRVGNGVAVRKGERRTERRSVREHILVMIKIIGRRLTKTEVVHHKDGNGLNNAVGNLFLFHCDLCHRHHHTTGTPLQYIYSEAHVGDKQGREF